MSRLLSDKKQNSKKAFTIAEMTVVLLILSIVMAAILPVTTNKRSSSSSGSGSLWKLARNNTDIWFAPPSSTQSVLMGTSQTPDAGGNGRLYINIPNSNSRSQIAMMYNNSTVGYIKFKNNGNIGLGANPIPSAISGSHNISIGQNALKSTTSGSHNVALGYQALGKTSTGTTNIALGQSTLYNNTTGNYNVGLGYNSIITNSTGSDNVGLGREALAKTTSSNNVAIGYRSFYNNSSGTGSTGLGYQAGNGNTTGSYNLSLGYQAYGSGTKTGNYNIALGYQTMFNANTSNNNNTGIGVQSLYSLVGGNNNTFVGYQTGYAITSGSSNSGFGQNSLISATTGSNNSALGVNACRAVTTGSNKACLGVNSGNGTLPNGFSTTNDTTQTIIGSGAGNIYLHAPTVQVRTGSNDNNNATFNVFGSTSTTTFFSAGTYANIGTYETIGDYLTVGNQATSTGYANIGLYANVPNLYVQNIRSKQGSYDYDTTIYGTLKGNWVPASDKRLKNIEGFAHTGLEEIKNLNTYKYTYKFDPKTQKIGLIAQDVEKVIPFAVQKGEDGYLSIIQDNIIYTMFNAIKDLDKLYESLKAKFQDYVIRLNLAEDRINALIEVNKDLSQRIDELEKRVNTLEKDFAKLEKKQCRCK